MPFCGFNSRSRAMTSTRVMILASGSKSRPSNPPQSSLWQTAGCLSESKITKSKADDLGMTPCPPDTIFVGSWNDNMLVSDSHIPLIFLFL